MRRNILIYLTVLVGILILGLFTDTVITLLSVKNCRVRIRKGQGWSGVLRDFDAQGCRSGLGLRLAAVLGVLEGVFGKPKVGTVQCNTTFWRCLGEVSRPVTIEITVIPGRDVWRNAKEIARQLGVPQDAIVSLLKDRDLARSLGIPLPSKAVVYSPFEGFLAPDTFRFSAGVEPREVIATLVKEQLRRLRKYPCDLEPYECLTLASIVEKESGAFQDMRKIARVFLNRLKKGIPLQSDPTMLYGPEGLKGTPNPRLKKDRRNPYNTYTHKGLPPGPICSPSLMAIRAVANPYDGPGAARLLYFVAKGDGTHYFSTSYKEHRKAIQRYLKRGGSNAGR